MNAIKDILSDYSKDAAAAREREKELQKLQLELSEIRLNAEIGKGGFAVVHMGVYHNKQCAVKVVKRLDGGRLNKIQKESVENELIMTRFLADPNILHWCVAAAVAVSLLSLCLL